MIESMSTVPPPLYPRVTWLEYWIHLPDTQQLVAGLQEHGSIGSFDYSFSLRTAIFTPKARFTTAADARAELEPMLEAWRVQTLIAEQFSMSFRHVDHELAAQPVDAKPSRPRRPSPLSTTKYAKKNR
jgi:hypothetical protein